MSDIQSLLKSAIEHGVVKPSHSAFLLAQASTAIDRLECENRLLRERLGCGCGGDDDLCDECASLMDSLDKQ